MSSTVCASPWGSRLAWWRSQDCASLSPASRQRPDKPSSPRHIPVPTIPGQSALTVTPSRATSLARALLKPITANFEAQ